jgi:pilus assembly protein CpaC
VPVVGDIPFIGAAFSSKNYNEEEHELVILVTPHLVDAMSCDQLPKYLPGQETRSPDDFELFLEGILEAPHGCRDVCQDGRYTPAYKNGPTAGQFPCCGGHCGGDGAFCGSSCGGSCNSCGGSCAGGSCGLGGGLAEGHDGAPATGAASAQPLSATKATARTGGAGDDDASPRPSKLPAATAEADRLK